MLVTPRQKAYLQGAEEVVEGDYVFIGTSRRNHTDGLLVGDREHRLHDAQNPVARLPKQIFFRGGGGGRRGGGGRPGGRRRKIKQAGGIDIGEELAERLENYSDGFTDVKLASGRGKTAEKRRRRGRERRSGC